MSGFQRKHIKLFWAVIGVAAISWSAAAQDHPPPRPAWLTLGPYFQFTDPGTAVFRWRTAEPELSLLEYEGPDGLHRIARPEPVTEHEIVLGDLAPRTIYPYRVLRAEGDRSGRYECETSFNYTLLPVPDVPPPYDAGTAQDYAALAERILADTGVTQGYCLDLGCGDGRLALELARRSNLIVIGVDTDPGNIAKARSALRSAGVYGPRVTVRLLDSLEALPFTQCFANLLVSTRYLESGALPEVAREAFRVLRPNGGAIWLGAPATQAQKVNAAALAAWFQAAGLSPEMHDEGGISAAISKRPRLEGAGEWTHQYGSPDNSSRSGDTLLGATHTGELQAQWLGQPGPRAMVDRNPRGPAPLYINGRLFTQGMHRIIAQDAFNGAISWSIEIPDLERYNMPRDCGNWCVDENFVYAAIRNACWKLDAATGRLAQVYPVIAPENAPGYAWGYLAQVGETLFGSAVREEAVYTEFRGKSSQGWYDSPLGPVTYKVASDVFYAVDKATGAARWIYQNGAILNSTITLADNTVFFAECRNAEVLASTSRRLGPQGLWDSLFLVALDADTGKTRWEHPLNTTNGNVVYYLLHANGTLVIAASQKDYRLHAFDAATGAAQWEAAHPWTNNDHSGHMQHPAVVGNTVYLEPCGYDLDTGARVTDSMGRHEGCATYAATEGALIYRGAGRAISLWDAAAGEVSGWPRLRPGCWLSTIAGGGMVLSPEAGGGCSCGGWMETSIGFLRKDSPQ